MNKGGGLQLSSPHYSIAEAAQMGDKVWLLWFEREWDEGPDTELLIGVYRTKEDADAAIDRLKGQPGFREFPQGFNAYERVLDKDGWEEGFARV